MPDDEKDEKKKKCILEKLYLALISIKTWASHKHMYTCVLDFVFDAEFTKAPYNLFTKQLSTFRLFPQKERQNLLYHTKYAQGNSLNSLNSYIIYLLNTLISKFDCYFMLFRCAFICRFYVFNKSITSLEFDLESFITYFSRLPFSYSNWNPTFFHCQICYKCLFI